MQFLSTNVMVRVLLANFLGLTLLVFTLTALNVEAKSLPGNNHLAGAAQQKKDLDLSGSQLPRNLPLVQQDVLTPAEPGLPSEDGVSLPPVTPITKPPLPDWVIALMNKGEFQPANGNITVDKVIETASGNSSTVFNGETISYTIFVTNNTGVALNNVKIIDVLPENSLDLATTGFQSACSGECELINTTFIISNSNGMTEPIEIPSRIEWNISSPISPTKSVSRTFSAKVFCQTDGSTLINSVFVNSDQGSDSAIVQSKISVQAEQNGQFSRSTDPTWCSTEVGYTYDLDWGDFDADGDLDLVLANIDNNAIVYRNEQGKLVRFWNSPYRSYSVRWADLNRDGKLELISVGAYVSPPGEYQNFIYRYDSSAPPGDEFVEETTFTTSSSPFRAAPVDYNNDGYLDLAVEDGIGCRVRLYPHSTSGYGNFSLATSECAVDTSYPFVRVMAWGDYDNDGDPDLAVSGYPTNRIFVNNNGTFSAGTLFEDFYDAYDLVWGDYDADGYLDLAAAYSGQRRVRVYHNDNAVLTNTDAITISLNSAPRGVDWGDFDNDGRLELAVGDNQPKIYDYDDATDTFSELTAVPSTIFGITNNSFFGSSGYGVWRIRGVDYDNDGDLDLSISNYYRNSLLFTMFAPRLDTSMGIKINFEANSVAWGDGDSDGDLDLLFGAGGSSFGGRLYKNNGRGDIPDNTSNYDEFLLSGFSPQSAAFGDVDGDNDLDIAFGAPGNNTVFLAGTTLPAWTSDLSNQSRSAAWGDVNDDGDLDLLVGNNGAGNTLYINQGTQLNTSPTWTSAEADATRSVAWVDYNNDLYPDFAVGNYGQPNRIYMNNKNDTFNLVWSSPFSNNTTSVDWGDYDGDGDFDLAVGNDSGQLNYVYEYQGNNTWTPTPISSETFNTTSLAWGDWDNDGDLDLAVGNYGQPDQVYNNLRLETGATQLDWRWTSNETYQTTGVAWGDHDRDGDLDLAISQDGAGSNGVYINHYVSPSHLTNEVTKTMPLPNNPSFVQIDRPGSTDAAYMFSSAEVLTGPTISIPIRLCDPDGPRNIDDPEGDDVVTFPTSYEFSLDGGATWKTANVSNTSNQTTRNCDSPSTITWDAQADGGISDNARFRLTVGNHIGAIGGDNNPVKRSGLNQYGIIRGISPPFRVRALPVDCVWPVSRPTIGYNPSSVNPSVPVNFLGIATTIGGSGNLTFTWNFGDNSAIAQGQAFQHTYAQDGFYTVVLTVTGEACPIAKQTVTNVTLTVGSPATGTITGSVYLPIIQKGAGSGTSSTEVPSIEDFNLTFSSDPGSPAQVTGLSGNTQLQNRTTQLQWTPDNVIGYRVYRAPAGTASFQLLADLPANTTTYTDDTATCGQTYFVTAYNAQGESLPSKVSYFSPPCP